MNGFKGFAPDESKDGNVRFEIDTSEVTKLVKKYKKLKKFQKSNIAELSKLSRVETAIDRLINEYGIDSGNRVMGKHFILNLSMSVHLNFLMIKEFIRMLLYRATKNVKPLCQLSSA